jgi:extracellular elastinolytic metalloproteinase
MWTRLVVLVAAGALALPGVGAAAGAHEDDLDARAGEVAPTAAQLEAVERLGAAARWNQFGSPASLAKSDGWLATGVAGDDAVAVARNFLDANAALFRLSEGGAAGLELWSDAKLSGGDGHAVVFRQSFGDLLASEGGMVVVGVVGDKVAYASSTLTGDRQLAAAPKLTAAEAWTQAAANVGRNVSLLAVGKPFEGAAWTSFRVDGIYELQHARLTAVPTPRDGVRPAWETLVVSNKDGEALGYHSFVDAATGEILLRKNVSEQSHSNVEAFTGTVPAGDGACAPDNGPWTVAEGEKVGTVVVAVEATLTTNDSVIHLLRDGKVVASQDTLTSPEALAYAPSDAGAGTYHVRVCDYSDGHGWDSPATYTGEIVFSPAGASSAAPYPPKWKVFPAYPKLGGREYPWNMPSDDIREIWCWEASVGQPPTALPECAREVQNPASRAPWDVSVRTGRPTHTTWGNNARTAEAWVNPPTVAYGNLTPGLYGYQPVSASREYVYPWTNAWNENGCTSEFVPGVSNDIAAATANLFAMHNRMHDWTYHLGLTERHWNAQDSNFGTGGTAEGDPVIGDVQAGAVSGGAPLYGGRDNANMLTLPDGVPPITNMYLWQPLAGAFYAPCVDGDYDMSVIGHEYGHMVENRMIGKGGTRGGHHAGAMGESSGDLLGVEVLHEYGYVPVSDENPFAVGAYVTGNRDRGIRNFGMNASPLNFSNMGYDLTGPQVHADGEIWSATNYDIRQAFVAKYGAGDAATQLDCAEGRRPADSCPGNRRWIQLMFDAYLLMPTAPSMLDARDAYLAADRMRYGGANQSELWLAFARRGFGAGAASSNTAADTDTDPTPDFASPLAQNATVTFTATDESGAPVNARVYVGRYEARVSPIADTNPATAGQNLDETAQFAPGTYELLAHAPGYGHVRLTRSFRAGQTVTVRLPLRTNWASAAKGATATGDGVRHDQLIDDTERTNWERTAAQPDVRGSQVTVNLSGTVQTVRRVQVSAMLLPGQNRFTALRQFEVQTCLESATNANCSLPSGWTTQVRSAEDAFPGVPPRPASPDLILRSFDLPAAVQATHVRIVVLTNQCTGNDAFQGEQDNDPANGTDCREGSPGTGSVITLMGDLPQVLAPRDNDVRIAELQVFSR